MKISMVEGSVGEDHRVLIGPFGGVTPSCTSLVPEMISWRKSDDPASDKIHNLVNVFRKMISSFTESAAMCVSLLVLNLQTISTIVIDIIVPAIITEYVRVTLSQDFHR